MDIRQKITYQFMAIVAILMFSSLLVIYILFSSIRQNDFYSRLGNKAKSIGQIIGELDIIQSDLVNRIERNNPTSLPNEIVIVFDVYNQILYSSGKSNTIKYPASIIERIKTELELKFRQNDYEVFGYYYEGSKENVIVFCAAADVFGIRKLKKLRLILISVFLFCLLIVFYLGRIYASKMLQPISDVVNQVNEIDISNFDFRIKERNTKDEIGRLIKTFNQLLNRLDSAIKIQKDFITNSSHELRNPLTAITGQIEVALLKERGTNEYKAALSLILEEIKKINQLINRLLILSRASSDFTADGFQPVRVDDILWEARTEILNLDKNNTIQIQFDDSIRGEHQFIMNGNAQLLKATFTNLFENGCKYSSNHTTTTILSVIENKLQLLFKDDGIGIPDEELNNIFQPFYRAGNVKKEQGYGIGLSLVEKIISLHKGTITVRSALNKGTEFKLLLPLK